MPLELVPRKAHYKNYPASCYKAAWLYNCNNIKIHNKKQLVYTFDDMMRCKKLKKNMRA